MQDHLQAIDVVEPFVAVETPSDVPFELTAEQLLQVGGGVMTQAPNSTW